MTGLLIGILVYYFYYTENFGQFNPLNAELNPICHFLALLGAHHILYISRIRVKEQITVKLTDYLPTHYTFLGVKRQLHVLAIKGSHYQAVSNKYLFFILFMYGLIMAT